MERMNHLEHVTSGARLSYRTGQACDAEGKARQAQSSPLPLRWTDLTNMLITANWPTAQQSYARLLTPLYIKELAL